MLVLALIQDNRIILNLFLTLFLAYIDVQTYGKIECFQILQMNLHTLFFIKIAVAFGIHRLLLEHWSFPEVVALKLKHSCTASPHNQPGVESWKGETRG